MDNNKPQTWRITSISSKPSMLNLRVNRPKFIEPLASLSPKPQEAQAQAQAQAQHTSHLQNETQK